MKGNGWITPSVSANEHPAHAQLIARRVRQASHLVVGDVPRKSLVGPTSRFGETVGTSGELARLRDANPS